MRFTFVSGMLAFLTLPLQAQYLAKNVLTLPKNLLSQSFTVQSTPYTAIEGGYNFNVIVGGNMTVSSGETEGRLLVAGNFTSGSTAASGCDPTNQYYSYATSYNTSGVGAPANPFPDQNLIIGGNMTFQPSVNSQYANWSLIGAMLYGGSISYTDTPPSPTFQEGNTTEQITGIVPSSAAIVTHYQTLSDQLAALPTNGTVNYEAYGPTVLTGTSSTSDFYVFSLDYSQMSDYGGISYANINPNASILLTITGATQMSIGSTGRKSFTVNTGSSITDLQANEQVLYNFPTATTIDFGFESLHGSILAPAANANFYGGSVNGMAVIGGNVSGCSGFEFHNPEVTLNFEEALPVTLTQFEGSMKESVAELKWSTSSEHNSSQFTIEHSLDAKFFKTIGTVQAQGTSVTFEHYQFVHQTPSAGANFYRLRLNDQDGTNAYSKIISVRKQTGQLVVAPNPIRNQEIILSGDLSQIKTLQLMDRSGKPLNAQVADQGQGNIIIKSKELRRNDLYFLSLDVGSGKPVQLKVFAY